MLTYNQFKLLKNIILNKKIDADTAKNINWAIQNNYVTKEGNLSKKGQEALKEYKVDNAVIMAAGYSSRFVPLSYFMPKGLIKIKGEVIIERQINQLKQAGINDITIITGYKSEMYSYLKEKYNIKLIYNNYYEKYNNLYSLFKVKNIIKNTYICSCDNYFVENVFSLYEYRQYYAGVYISDKTDEFCAEIDNDMRIIKAYEKGENAYTMFGHAYFTKSFSKKFFKLLSKQSNKDIYKSLWDTFFTNNTQNLNLYIKPYDANIIYEFDNMQQSYNFDNNFLKANECQILDNIVQVLECEKNEILEILPLSGGLTNKNFTFKVCGQKYVYRHPNNNLKGILQRSNECEVMHYLKNNNLDDTLIYIDKIKFWKISKYINGEEFKDKNNTYHIKLLMQELKKIHAHNPNNINKFDVYESTHNIYNLIKNKTSEIEKIIENFDIIYNDIKDELDYSSLCHLDCYLPNIIVNNNDLKLIDWEYAAISDKYFDIANFISGGGFDVNKAIEIYKLYNNDEISRKLINKLIACTALISGYWYVWSIYQIENNNNVLDYCNLCKQSFYNYNKEFMRINSVVKV